LDYIYFRIAHASRSNQFFLQCKLNGHLTLIYTWSSFDLSIICSYQTGLSWLTWFYSCHRILIRSTIFIGQARVTGLTQFIFARRVWWRWRLVTTSTCLSSSMSRPVRIPEICSSPPTTATSKNWSLRCEKTCLRSARVSQDGYTMHIVHNKTKE